MRYIYVFVLLVISATAISAPSYAISDQERIDQLERDVLILQRKLSRQGESSGSPAVDDVTGMGGGQTDNRITALEEEVRTLRGRIEEKDFDNKRLAEQLDLLKRDVEMRLGDLEKNGAAATTAPAPAEPAKPAPHAAAPENTVKPLAAPAQETTLKPASKMEVSVKDAPTTPQADTAKPSETNFDSPRDQYNYAFRLLNQNQHDEAAKSFTSFIAKNPKDPLVGNAYYWLGETYYIRGDYPKATDQFRQGFEAMPKGPKAADNLLKLGMSLGRENKNKEACIVLAQVMDKYKAASPNTATKAASEHKRLSCG